MVNLKLKLFTIVFSCFFIFVSIYLNSNAQEFVKKSESTQYANKENIHSTIDYITSYNRCAGSEGEVITCKYLKNKLEDYGYIVSFQEFNVYDNIYSKKLPVKSKNVIAKNKKYKSNKKNIYLTAHYDSIKITNGVIDNSTGVSAVLELSRLLKDSNDCNIIPIFFGAEENGLIGSDFFVNQLNKQEKNNAIGCINFDMIGVKDSGDIVMWVYEFPYQNKIKKENIIQNMLSKHNIKSVILKNNLEGGTDAIPFYMEGMPSVTLVDENINLELSFNESRKKQLESLDLEKICNICNSISYIIKNIDKSN